jgi:uncharacterized protein (TIRG00374 family)
MLRRNLNLAIGIAISCVSLWLLFRSVPLDEIVKSLRAPNYWWLIPSLVFGFLAMWIQAARWHILTSPLKKIAMLEIFTATSIGLMFNNVLPFRLGEYARVYVLTRQDEDLPQAPVLATVLVERLVFDLGFLIAVVLWVFLFVPHNRSFEVAGSAVWAALFLLIPLAIIIFTAAKPQSVCKVASFVLRLLRLKNRDSVQQSIYRFADMIIRIRRVKIATTAIVLTGLTWLSMAVSIHFLFISFSFSLPFSASFVLLGAVALAIFLPSLPGSIGTFHLAAALALSVYAIAGADARAFSIVLHLSQYIPTTVIGLVFLRRVNLSIKQMRKNVAVEKL